MRLSANQEITLMAQQQKTDNPGLDLPDLTPKQMGYVLARLDGKTKTESVRQAVDTAKWSNNAVWVEGHKLENNPNVRLWMQYIQLHKVTAASITHDKYIADLIELKLIAIQSGNIGAAVNAMVNIGKSTGHMTERTEVTHKTDRSELDTALEQLRQAGVEVDIVTH